VDYVLNICVRQRCRTSGARHSKPQLTQRLRAGLTSRRASGADYAGLVYVAVR
jgi:hypothetical protein